MCEAESETDILWGVKRWGGQEWSFLGAFVWNPRKSVKRERESERRGGGEGWERNRSSWQHICLQFSNHMDEQLNKHHFKP